MRWERHTRIWIWTVLAVGSLIAGVSWLAPAIGEEPTIATGTGSRFTAFRLNGRVVLPAINRTERDSRCRHPSAGWTDFVLHRSTTQVFRDRRSARSCDVPLRGNVDSRPAPGGRGLFREPSGARTAGSGTGLVRRGWIVAEHFFWTAITAPGCSPARNVMEELGSE